MQNKIFDKKNYLPVTFWLFLSTYYQNSLNLFESVNATQQKLYVLRALEGDKQAFNLLAEFYYPQCLAKAKALVGDSALAQDLTQISLLQAFHCLDKLKDPTQFKYWLLGIVRNISYSYLKEKKKQMLSLAELGYLLLEANQEQASEELQELILSAIYALPKAYQEIILAFYYDGKTLQDIACQQGLSLSAAKVRLHRARLLLKQSLSSHPELLYYYQTSIKKTTMELVTIADIYLKEDGAATILLQTEKGEYFLPIVVGYFEAQAIVMGLQNLQMPRPGAQDLAASIISVTGTKLAGVYINKISQGVYYSYLSIENGHTLVEVDARPSDAIAIAVRLQAPIFVAGPVLEQAGIPIPKPYQQAKSKEKGINQFVRYYAQSKIHHLAHQAIQQKQVQAVESKKPDKLDQWVVDLLFGEAAPPKVNLAWQPKRYTTWEEALKETEKVEWLDLKDQQLNDFSEKIQPLSRVKILELTGYRLREVPAGIEQFKKLSHLNLANNHLSDLPTTLNQLPQLREMNLSKNQFTKLPENLTQISGLQKLDVSENAHLSLAQAFDVLGEVKSLHHLLLTNNGLTTIPQEITKLASLAILALDHNPMLDLTVVFARLQRVTSLTMLELQHLDVVSLPEQISLLAQLSGLNLNDNPKIDLPSLCLQLSQLENLKVLMLMRCNLSVLPEELHLLNKLEVLELGENLIPQQEQVRIRKMLPNTTIVF